MNPLHVATFTINQWKVWVLWGQVGGLIPLMLDWFVNFEATLMPQALFHDLQAAPEWYFWCLRPGHGGGGVAC